MATAEDSTSCSSLHRAASHEACMPSVPLRDASFAWGKFGEQRSLSYSSLCLVRAGKMVHRPRKLTFVTMILNFWQLIQGGKDVFSSSLTSGPHPGRILHHRGYLAVTMGSTESDTTEATQQQQQRHFVTIRVTTEKEEHLVERGQECCFTFYSSQSSPPPLSPQ